MLCHIQSEPNPEQRSQLYPSGRIRGSSMISARERIEAGLERTSRGTSNARSPSFHPFPSVWRDDIFDPQVLEPSTIQVRKLTTLGDMQVRDLHWKDFPKRRRLQYHLSALVLKMAQTKHITVIPPWAPKRYLPALYVKICHNRWWSLLHHLSSERHERTHFATCPH